MLAGVRFCFLFWFAVMVLIAALLPVQAQVNGVAPSVTSMGFGGRAINGVPPSVTSIGFGGNFINGIRPSVTSLGPDNNLGNYFLWPSNTMPSSNSHHRHHRDHDVATVGVFEPAYIPYAPEAIDDDSADADASSAPVVPLAPKRAVNGDMAAQSDAASSTDDDPVVAQPSTVLVFKDGHQADVLNYAIVGDTLFDFETDRTRKIQLADLDLSATRKANDDRGVDFQIPSTAVQ